MRYVLRDLQFTYRLFADGATFRTKHEAAEQLRSYHSIDCDEESLNRMTDDEVIGENEWSLEPASEHALLTN